MITGLLNAKDKNDYGYPRIQVGGKWYGSDKKGSVAHAEGDFVQFEDFKNDRGYASFKYETLKSAKAPAGAATTSSSPTPAARRNDKDDYWTKKAGDDAAREPRIAYFASLERAIQLVDLAIRAGAFGALEKAKPEKKLGILQALVEETTLKIMAASYAAVVPQVEASTDEADAPLDTADTGEQELWA